MAVPPPTVALMLLQPGDIIVSTSEENSSKRIRAATGSAFSHAIIYAGGSNVIEAVSTGVTERAWRSSSGDMLYALGLRYRGISSAQRRAVVGFARKAVGRPFDKLGAYGAGIFRSDQFLIGLANLAGITLALKKLAQRNAMPDISDAKFFCSELVARSYEAAGIPLFDRLSASYVNPKHVRHCSKLMPLNVVHYDSKKILKSL